MSKLSKRPVDPKLLDYYINNLWSAFTLIDSKEEIRAFFRDMFTHTEYKMFAKRLEIARRLLKGQTYDSISNDLKVTEHTISTISNALERDGTGLRIAHQKLTDLEKSFQRKRDVRQDYLERKNFPKPREQGLAKNLIKVGVRKINQALRSRTRESSAKKPLIV